MIHVRFKHIGALLGLAFAWFVVQYGFFQAVFVAVAVGLGWFLGRILDGEVDVAEYVRRRDVEDLE